MKFSGGGGGGIYFFCEHPKSLRQFSNLKVSSTSSLRASSPIWASETSLARTRERAAPCSLVLARLASLTQIGELARRLYYRYRYHFFHLYFRGVSGSVPGCPTLQKF